MPDNKKFRVTVIMPVYNGETTISKTLESLSKQTRKPDEIIIINDGSTDSSLETLNKNNFGLDYKLMSHEKNWGLARTYNEGVKFSTGDLIITMHQDVILMDDSLEKLISPFSDSSVVATSHIVTHPMSVWEEYNFWQKCFFARLVGKDFSGIDGKFDCFRKKSLLEVGLFDEIHFKSAGEDGDMVFRLKKIGKIVDTDAKIIHLHKNSLNFSYKDIIYKQKQYSEAQGVLLRLGKITSIKGILKSFFREFLIILLFVPYLQLISLGIIFLYSFLYTKKVYLTQFRDRRIFLLPIFNIYLLFVSFIFSFKGIIYGKQKV